MPRNIPVGNGELLVTFDDLYRVRDIHYPRIGLPNHTGGHVQRFGIWADGVMAWIDDPSWSRHLRYKPDSIVTHVSLRNEMTPDPESQLDIPPPLIDELGEPFGNSVHQTRSGL